MGSGGTCMCLNRREEWVLGTFVQKGQPGRGVDLVPTETGTSVITRDPFSTGPVPRRVTREGGVTTNRRGHE